MKSITVVSSCEGKRPGVENAKDYSVGAIRLINSLRKNGGMFKDATVLMWHSEELAPSPEQQEKLKDLGCTLVPGRNDSGNILHSKVQAISDCAKVADTDYLLWLDSDMLVVGELDVLVDYMGVDFAATATEFNHHRLANEEDLPLWENLCKATGTPFEKFSGRRLMTMMDGKIGLFNFNSGIMLFDLWTFSLDNYVEMANTILSKSKEDETVSNYCFDATPLSLIATKYHHSWAKLPMALNHYYALHKSVAPDTKVIHYQDNDLSSLYPDLW
jgi:hypothetical protein